jgi:antibiotic biosynthesis monooxygenase (ABM) superfamily enzyme
MPLTVTVTITTIKPDGTVWFLDSSDENRQAVDRIKAWTESQPGFISYDVVDTDVNTKAMTFKFDSVKNYFDWFSLRNELPEQIARAAYNNANGITSTKSETVS